MNKYTISQKKNLCAGELKMLSALKVDETIEYNYFSDSFFNLLKTINFLIFG